MKAALDEISHWAEFDHTIINSDLDTAISQARSVLTAARLATQRQRNLSNIVAAFNKTA